MREWRLEKKRNRNWRRTGREESEAEDGIKPERNGDGSGTDR